MTLPLRILRRFAVYRWRVLLTVSLIVANVLLTMLSPLLLADIIDSALPRRNTGELSWLCGGMVAVGLLSAAISVAQGALIHSVCQKVVHRLRVDLFSTVQRMPVGFFTSTPVSEVQSRLVSDIGGISDILTVNSLGFITALINLAASSLLMLYLSWPLALVSIALGWLFSNFNRRFTRRRRELTSSRQESVDSLMRIVSDHLSLPGVLTGRTLGRARRQQEEFIAVSARTADLSYRQKLAGRTAFALVFAGFSCLPPIVYWVSGTVLTGLSVGTVVVMVLLQGRVAYPIQQIMQSNADLQASRVMFERVFAFLDLTPDQSLPEADSSLMQGPTGVRLTGVCSSYDGRPVLRDVSLAFPPGSTTVVVGASGSGKSTLAMVIAGLLPPMSGDVEFYGAHQRSGGRAVALVPQVCAMFEGSVEDNIRFGRPDASPAELHSVVNLLQLGDLVSALPDGLRTTVGEAGYRLSGGERQRIALARAVLAGHPVLVLDEATSAVDSRAAQDLHDAVRSLDGSRTLIVVAHRIPRVRPQDQVVVLADGTVVEAGTHDELLRRGGAYALLTRAQQLRAVTEPADL